ncbi:MAG: right-handed parallel beta-helix repeat-containing protein [Planctomycetota bacterium]|nr:right-handed parallel beta-helix repeat-containing protein [Planctomycetota bacterium]
MKTTHNPRVSRRQFVTAAAAAATTGWTAVASAAGPARGGLPRVTRPRATSGDTAHEPNWDEKLTITVGPKKADLVGSSDKVLQAAVDYVSRFGGGTVQVMPGTYTLRNSIYLRTGIHILGSGADSVLTKGASHSVALADDSDWYDQEVTVASGKGLRVGDGVVLKTRNPHNGGSEVLKRTLVARKGNRFKLDRALRKNYWLSGKPTLASLFPLISGDHVHDIAIQDITLDGNRKQNANLNGNYGGCVFLQDCNRIHMTGVEARNYNGDGISWQICHDVVVENCHSHDNADLGLHPGSGSQRPLMRNNRVERNTIGVFFCWGIKYGLAENNQITGNRSYGVSIGHCDTDNLIRLNTITGSGKVGVLFRDDARGKDFWPNRNTLEKNQIVDSGDGDGVAVDVQGRTRDVTLDGNQIRETRKPMERIGVRIGKQARDVKLQQNKIEGFQRDVVDLKAKP